MQLEVDSNGPIEHHKARLVAKGFTKKFGVDYKKTFALVTKMTTVPSKFFLLLLLKMPFHTVSLKKKYS